MKASKPLKDLKEKLLNSQKMNCKYKKIAPASGLYLWKIKYDFVKETIIEKEKHNIKKIIDNKPQRYTNILAERREQKKGWKKTTSIG